MIDQFKAFEEKQAKLFTNIPHPDLPKTDNLSGQQLEENLGHFAGWLAFLTEECGKQEGRVHALSGLYKAKISMARAQWANIPSSKMAETAKDDAALAGDPQLQTIREMLVTEEALLKTAQGIMKAFEDCYNAISRIVEVRKIEAQASARTSGP